jgi:hypothetical protein
VDPSWHDAATASLSKVTSDGCLFLKETVMSRDLPAPSIIAPGFASDTYCHQEKPGKNYVPRDSPALLASEESEDRFRETFESAAVGIAQVAADGSWLETN